MSLFFLNNFSWFLKVFLTFYFCFLHLLLFWCNSFGVLGRIWLFCFSRNLLSIHLLFYWNFRNLVFNFILCWIIGFLRLILLLLLDGFKRLCAFLSLTELIFQLLCNFLLFVVYWSFFLKSTDSLLIKSGLLI